MRNSVLCAAVFLFLTSVANAQVVWHTSPALAIKEARETGRPLLVYLTTSNCPWCVRMENECWASPQVAEVVSSKFVPLKIFGNVRPLVAERLGVRMYPTTIVLNLDATKKLFISGYLPEQRLVPFLEGGP